MSKSYCTSTDKNGNYKKQSEILSKLLKILNENKQSFDVGLDYINMVQLSVFFTLRDYGFIYKEHKNIIESLNNNVNGWKICVKEGIFKDAEIIGVFKDTTRDSKLDLSGSEKFEKLKEGKIHIDRIYLTNQHSEFIKLLIGFRDDPFLPKSIHLIMAELMNDINNNGVYNNFNHSRVHHGYTFKKLKNDIRNYLRIDERW